MRRQSCYFTAVLMLVAVAGCQSVEPSNPFDPDTPSGDKATASLVGTVSAEAAAAAAISVAMPELGISRAPGPDGAFEIGEIPAGMHLIEVSAAGHVTHRDSRYFPVGGTVVLELTLRAHRGALRGAARLEGEARHGGILVTLAAASPPPTPGLQALAAAAGLGGATALTDGDGNYVLGDVPVGTYRLSMEKEGFARGGVAEVSVTAETVTDVETVVLKPVTGAVDVFGGPDYDTPDYDNVHYSRTQEVRLRVFGFNAVEMKISESADLADSDWEEYATERSWTLSDGDGAKTLYVRLRDGEGNESELLQGHTVLDRAAPEVGEHSLLIDGGAMFSADPSGLVDLALRADDATSGTETMWISTDPDLTGAAPQGYGERVPGFRVASGDTADDGLKTVYARFADVAGNVSDVVSAQIYMDRQPPANAAVSVDGLTDGFARMRPPLLVLSADESCDDEYPGGCDAGLTAPAEVQLSESDAFAHAVWQPFSEFVSFDLSPGDGDKTVHARFRDGAGNISLAASASFVLDTVVPSGPSVLVADGASSVNSAVVTLALYCEGADEMILGDSPDFGAASWVPYAETASFDLLGDDGLHTVYARFRDQAGNLSEVTLDSVVLDTAAPVIPDGGLVLADRKYDGIAHGFTDQAAMTVFLQASGADEMKVSTRADLSDASWEAFASSAAVLLSADGLSTVYLCVRDVAGNQSCEFAGGGTASVQTFLDRQPPFAPVLAAVARPVVAEDQVTVDLDVASADPGEGTTGAFLTHQVRGGAFADWTDVADVSGGLSFDLAAGDGDYLLEVRGKDRAGNVSAVDLVPVSRDTVAPPTPVLRTGAEPPVVNQEIYSVMLDPAAAERPTDDPHFSHYEMIGGQLGEWTFTAATDSFPFLLVQGSPTPSSNTLTLRAVDQAGNVSGEASITVIEDSVPPTPPELYPPGGTVVADWVSLSLSSPGSDDYPSHYEVLGGEYLNFTEVGSFAHYNEPGTIRDLRVGLRPNRANEISVRLVDRAGNASYPSSVTVVEQRYAEVGTVEARNTRDPQISADHSLIAVPGWTEDGGSEVGFWWASGQREWELTTRVCNFRGESDFRDPPPVAQEGALAAIGGSGVTIADVAQGGSGAGGLHLVGNVDVRSIALYGREGLFVTEQPLELLQTPPGPAVDEDHGPAFYGVVYRPDEDRTLRAISMLVPDEVFNAWILQETEDGGTRFFEAGEDPLCVMFEPTLVDGMRWISFYRDRENTFTGQRVLLVVEADRIPVHAVGGGTASDAGGALERGIYFENSGLPTTPVAEADLHDLAALPFVRVLFEAAGGQGEDTRSVMRFGPGEDGEYGGSDDVLQDFGRLPGHQADYRLFADGATLEVEAATGNRGYLVQAPDVLMDKPSMEFGVALSCSGPWEVALQLYEADQLDGSYTLVHSQVDSDMAHIDGPGDLVFPSNGLEAPLRAGKFYYLVQSWNGPCAPYRSSGTLPAETRFGTFRCALRDQDLGGSLFGGAPPETLQLDSGDCAAATAPVALLGSLNWELPTIESLRFTPREVSWTEVDLGESRLRYLQADAGGDYSGATPQTLIAVPQFGDTDSGQEAVVAGSDRYLCWSGYLEESQEVAVRCHDRGPDGLLGTADDPASAEAAPELFRLGSQAGMLNGVSALSVYQGRLAVLVVKMPRFFVWVYDIASGQRIVELPASQQIVDIALTGDVLYLLETGVGGRHTLYRHSFSRNRWIVASEQEEEYLPGMLGDELVFARGTGDMLLATAYRYDPQTATAEAFDLGAEGGFLPMREFGRYLLFMRLPPGWGMDGGASAEYGLHDPQTGQYTRIEPNLDTGWPRDNPCIVGTRLLFPRDGAGGANEVVMIDLVDDTYGNGDDLVLDPAFTAGSVEENYEIASDGRFVVLNQVWSSDHKVFVHDLQTGTTIQRDDIDIGRLWTIRDDWLIHTIENEPGVRFTKLPLAATPETVASHGQWFENSADYRPMRSDGARHLLFPYTGGGWPLYVDLDRFSVVPAGVDLVSRMDLPYNDTGIARSLDVGRFVYTQQGPFTSDLYLYEVGEVF